MPSYSVSAGSRSRLGLTQKKNNRYRRPSSRKEVRFNVNALGHVFGWVVVGSVSLMFFVAISLGLLASYRWMTNYTFFQLDAVEVAGNTWLSYNEVLSLSGVTVGDNCLSINMNDMEAQLSANPWIDRVAVKRILPGKLSITLAERQPIFWVRRDNKLFYADKNGNLIDEVTAEKIQALPLLEVENESAVALDAFFELFKDMGMEEIPMALAEAAWVKVRGGNCLEMYFDAPHCLLSIGMDDWDENVRRLNLVWDDLKKRGDLVHVKAIRAHGNNVWVSKS